MRYTDDLLGRRYEIGYRSQDRGYIILQFRLADIVALDPNRGLKLWFVADRSSGWVSVEEWETLIAKGLVADA